MARPILVRLRHPLCNATLSLHRAPKYLRFTLIDLRNSSCVRNWDALDQLDDQPEPHERLFAAILKHEGSLHVDRTVKGRRVGEWHKTAEYELIEPQPSDMTLRDNELWRQWCLDQEADLVAEASRERRANRNG